MLQREWLIAHGLLRSDAQKTRDELVGQMNKYYYDTMVCHRLHEYRSISRLTRITSRLHRRMSIPVGPTPR